MNINKFYSNHLTYYTDYGVDTKEVALLNGLLNYYETATLFDSANQHNYLEKTLNGIFVSEVRSDDFIIKYTMSISLIHLFFEQYIFAILEEIHPVLSRGNFKEINLSIILSRNYKHVDYKQKRRIKFRDALDRVIDLIKENNDLPMEYKVSDKYHFIKEHESTLKNCAELRNDIIHSGETTLNRYAYELLFANEIIPLIQEFLSVISKPEYFERSLFCKKNVLSEISKMRLPTEYKQANYEDTIERLRRINHFKELGRASILNGLMVDNTSDDKEQVEKLYNHPRRNIAIQIANTRLAQLGHQKLFTCPCCGTETLTTFLSINSYELKATCALCTYTVNRCMGEPKDFGFMQSTIFS